MTTDPKELLARYEPKQTRVLELDRQVIQARLAPSGRLLFAGDFDGRVRRWDLSGEEPQELEALTGHSPWVTAVRTDPAGENLLVGDSWGELRCWSANEKQPKLKWEVTDAHDGWLRDLAVSPNGKRFATCGLDKMVRIWTTADGKPSTELAEHADEVFATCWHPDGKHLVTGDLKGRVCLWDLSTGKIVREFDAGVLFKYHRLQDVGGVRCLAIDPTGRQLAVGGTIPAHGGTVVGTPTLLVFDLDSGKLTQTHACGDTNDAFVWDLEFHPDGFLMYVTNGTPGRGKLRFQMPDAEEPFFESKGMANCHSVSFHQGSNQLAVAATNKGSNGNGRRVDKDGNYISNTSPIHLFALPEPTA